MNDWVKLQEKPIADEIHMIAGWQQWADAGSVSSALPRYLIGLMHARKIGEITPYGFYLFQVPGTHAFLRPEVKIEEGYCKELSTRANEFYYAGDEHRGLVIFTGEEPQVNAEGYAEAFFDAVKQLGVKRVVIVGGVYGAMPYDKEREVSCVYSLPSMKDEMEGYAVRFSNYEGGVSIGTYMAHWAGLQDIELAVFYSFVPAYDFSEITKSIQGIRVENDYKAWHEMMRRINHMFHLGLDLSDLDRRSSELVRSMHAKVDELEEKAPQLKIREFLAKVAADFTETPFMPLDVWERGLGDLLDDPDE